MLGNHPKGLPTYKIKEAVSTSKGVAIVASILAVCTQTDFPGLLQLVLPPSNLCAGFYNSKHPLFQPTQQPACSLAVSFTRFHLPGSSMRGEDAVTQQCY